MSDQQPYDHDHDEANPPAAVDEAPAHPDAQVTHSKPTLTTGAHGPDVLELVALLAKAGYDNNSVAQGTNTVGYLDETVMNDVRAFAREHGITEAVENWVGRESVRAEQMVENHVGPRIWAKLLHVAGELERAILA